MTIGASPHSSPVLVCTLMAAIGVCAMATGQVDIIRHNGLVTIENRAVRVEYDTSTGTFRALDVADGSNCLAEAHFRANEYTSTGDGLNHTWTSHPIDDALGTGKALLVTCAGENGPDLLHEISLYRGRGIIVLRGGITNTTDEPIQLKSIEPLAGAAAFEGLDLSRNFSMLDGNGGGEGTRVVHGGSLHSRNNLLVTFGRPGRRRSLVIGGLTYHDFEKFADAGEALSRRQSLDQRNDEYPLLCYLDLPKDMADGEAPGLSVVQGKPYVWGGASRQAAAQYGSIVFHEEKVVLEATGLDPDKCYVLGLSWWDFDANGRVQSLLVEAGQPPIPQMLLQDQPLPAWRDRKQLPVEILIPLPQESDSSGQVRIIIENASRAPNAVLSEAWLRECDTRRRIQTRPIQEAVASPRHLRVGLSALDPVGKRVDPGVRYLPEDRFYVDFSTDNPFEALETYGRAVRHAQDIDLNVYDFPTVCLWYAEVFGGGQARNDTIGAVNEMNRIADSGFLRYSRAAVRLVPDLYAANNQQGWWDDEHWRRGRSSQARGNGQYVEPYDTTAGWAGAVTDLGGIPLTYFQTSFRSEDYAEMFPEHMLFNEARAPKTSVDGKPREYSPDMNAWQRNAALHGYDFTDPDFVAHMKDVYANLRSAGVKGLMFDYPSSGWAAQGGMEDDYSTTAAAYRNIFRLAYEGLGPDCWIHERALARGSDISLGLVTSQRVWGDTDRLTPPMATRCGLRWYKNRVVVSYDMDAKSLLKAQPENRDGVRKLLTMCYVVSGRLLLGNSFGALGDDALHDLTRIYPYHADRQSARPVDAFTSEYLRIYDFEVNPNWHQVTFYNTDNENPATVSVDLAGDASFGALGLDPDASYYVYDFWNDNLVGELGGSERLTQRLRPGEARMMSVRRVADHPQFISADRHIMQGLVNLSEVEWHPDEKTLSGRARLVAGEPFTVVIALNGYQPVSSGADGAAIAVEKHAGKAEIARATMHSDTSDTVQWQITFTR